MVNAEPLEIVVVPGATVGEYVDQLTSYLDQSGPTFADLIARIWARQASDCAMPTDVAMKVAELALAAHKHRP
jgi:hypothetical protein